MPIHVGVALLVCLVSVFHGAKANGPLPDVHVHGVVRDSADRRPLAGATIRIHPGGKGAIADRDGVFHLHDVEEEPIRLAVSYVGYETRIVTIAGRGPDRRVEIVLARAEREAKTVVVQADRESAGSPTQQVATVTQAEVDEHRGQTFADALRGVAGVTVLQTGPSIAKPMIHGMTGVRLVTLNAGVVQEGQQWGAEHAPEIDPFTPGRIQVVTGPASVLYGPNAIGGVISVEPRPLQPFAAGSGELSLNGFLNNRQGAVALWGEKGGLFGLPLAMRVQGSLRQAGDAATPDYILNNTGFQERNGAVDAVALIGGVRLAARASVFSTTLGIFSGAHIGTADDLRRAIERGRPRRTEDFSYDIARPRQEIQHTLTSLQIDGVVGDGILRATIGWQRNERAEFDAHNARIVGRGTDPVERARDSIARLERSLSTPAMELLLNTTSLDVRWEGDAASSLRFTMGLSGMHQANDRRGAVFIVPDYSAYGAGGYVMATHDLPSVTLSAGVRYDHRWLDASITRRNTRTVSEQERLFGNVSASIGALWRMAESWTLRTNVGTGWRPPQVNELYAADVHHGTALFEIGDSTLGREQSVGADATLGFQTTGVDASVTASLQTFDGFIQSLPDVANPTVTIRGTFPTFRYRQTNARIAALDARIIVAASPWLSPYASLNIVRGTDVSLRQPLFLMPADRARVGAHIHFHDAWQIHDAFLDVSFLTVARQQRVVAGQDYAEPPPGYTTMDVRVGGTIHVASLDVRLTLDVQNMFDARFRDYLSRFRYFADDPGRNVILRATVPI